MTLRDQLQATLGDAYRLEQELGGGGMSRVFLATETALSRRVVVKVLPPELVQGVSTDRFRREIQLAAQLQHPHIVPVHTTGTMNGLPYYTMPFVEGASLRTRLAKGGALPISETIAILRDVAKALAYAHERGVVHRDIKPDNVLLSGGSATVTDFGIAKALSASRTETGETLTSIGTSIGTPTYMAPEQAAADPSTNHRADLYSLGCMAYEMLCGRPPFIEKTPQKLLAAHMAERPVAIAELRPDTPPALAELVMKCLEKDSDLRPQSATEVVRVLEMVTSGSGTPAMPQILLGRRPKLARVLAAYAGGFIAAYVLARAAVVGVGLPTWVVAGTMIVMALGLPVILITALVQQRAYQAMTLATLTPGGSTTQHGTVARLAIKASPWVSWRRTTIGGIVALGVFALLIAGYMITRALGIGPAASLMAAGSLGANERLLIADFKSPAADTTLGPVVTEAFRADLAQSRAVEVVQPTLVRDALRRMQRPAETRVDFAVAREIATREGVKAVIDGEVLGLGGGYVLAAKLVTAQSGEVLATFRETAAEPKDIIPAIDRLSRAVRGKIGESLRKVNATRSLEQVTTPSLEALRKYVEAVELFDRGVDFDKGRRLLEEATALDSGFAMAYRKLGLELGNRGGFTAAQVVAIQKAYDHRDRLTDLERFVTTGSYFTNGPVPDETKAMEAYDQALEVEPKDIVALNNSALIYITMRQFAKAEERAKRGVSLDSTVQALYSNLLRSQIALGKWDEANATLAKMQRNIPRSFSLLTYQTLIPLLQAKRDSAQRVAKEALRTRSGERAARREAARLLAMLAQNEGRINEANDFTQQVREVNRAQGSATADLGAALTRSINASWFKGQTAQAVAILDSALKAANIEQLDFADRPYLAYASAYALAGRTDKAKELVGLAQKNAGAFRQRIDDGLHSVRGDVALAERRYDEAIKEYRAADRGPCQVCTLPQLAQAYDLAGNADSAIAIFTRFAETPTDAYRMGADGRYLAGTYKRLGELYESKGDRAKATKYYSQFVDLWKRADPELQPKVAEVKAKLARLGDGEVKR